MLGNTTCRSQLVLVANPTSLRNKRCFRFTFLHEGPDLEQSRACWPAGKHQVIQAVFFGICVLTDLSSLLTKGNDSQEQERQLKKLISLRDWVMAVLAFPVGVRPLHHSYHLPKPWPVPEGLPATGGSSSVGLRFVVTMFWSIYIYDRELVYPKLLDNFIPAWLNHGMHTTVLPFVLIEMRTTHHQYPSRSCGLAAVCTFAVGYILWVCWIHHVTGVWVYPLLEHLSPGVKIIFFAAVTVIINIFYLVGEVLNNYIWDTQKCIEEGKEKPKLD
ncbi:PREDICTED: androgen-induced gene 1 protein isoform X1 [Haliaeetus leucocephalus]|uniref:androgen-induced gene 1 protein isoform X1 n=1 Tax=Haliaeetus leucocephalus TaxID=52644 RepID=UPI000522574B|nr:PREDICTED: androgen-induced gene 1 protein isoform X2 [Haliaeetus albicilla]XP_010572895.1 PREDICTED: androgen-induced gene 1 protein isoform X1 [Haliaeetus leucocephalus]